MNTNLNSIINEINILKKEEAKVNYYFEPMYTKRNKNWKRHLIFFELKQDFIKDVTDYGFSPYIAKTYSEQRDNKNILRFCKSQDYGFSDYLKKIHKPNRFEEALKKDNTKEKNIKFLDRILDSNKRKKEIINKIIKINQKNNNFLCKIYDKLNHKEKNEKTKIVKYKKIKNQILTPKKKKLKIINFSSPSRNNEINKIESDEKNKLKNNLSFIYESTFNKNNRNKLKIHQYKKQISYYKYKKINEYNFNNNTNKVTKILRIKSNKEVTKFNDRLLSIS